MDAVHDPGLNGSSALWYGPTVHTRRALLEDQATFSVRRARRAVQRSEADEAVRDVSALPTSAGPAFGRQLAHVCFLFFINYLLLVLIG